MMYHLTIAITPTEKPINGRFVTTRGLHGLLFNVLKQSDSAETEWLHTHEAPKPFSMVTLYNPAGHLAGLRYATLTPRITNLFFNAWQVIAQNQEVLQLGRYQTFQVTNVEATPGPTFQELTLLSPSRQMHLLFLSPTAFKQGSGSLPLPLPINVFQGPFRVWQAFAPFQLPDEWLECCQQEIFVVEHRIETAVTPSCISHSRKILMNNEQLVTQALALQPQLTPTTPTAVSPTAFIQRYDTTKGQLAAYLIAQPQTPAPTEQADLLQLFQKIQAGFNESEVQDLCFRLNINYEEINGRSLSDKIRELITYCQRRGRLSKLIATCAELRPHVTWHSGSQIHSNTAIVGKLDMAVVIDVARPALPGVAHYLDNRGVATNFVVFRHIEPGLFFTVGADWQQLTTTFSDVMDRVKREFAGTRLHFFLAGPGALLFALGCIWGTVDVATIYHYEGNTYHPVLETTRDLRQITTGWS